MFDIRKAIAATGYLCSLNGGSLNILHLIKMLYAADRTALVHWHRTITGDKFVSMKNGPILSHIYDLMCGRGRAGNLQAWNLVFKPRNRNTIQLSTNVNLGPLSRRELDVLKQAFEYFINVPGPQLVTFLHQVLPEWKDPGESSAPIDPKAILVNAGLTEEQIDELEEELDMLQSAKLALQAH